MVETLQQPLVHLGRNALDHGVEPPEDHIAGGKDADGPARGVTRHAGGNVVITSTTAAGVDPAVRAARGRGAA